MRGKSLDPQAEAAAAFMAHAAPSELRAIASTAARFARLVGRLEKFSFPLVAAPLAGLLIRSENHTATARIEALIHLAALACRGDRKPELRQLHEWLNVALYNDPITELEVPVEDVFVSNVDAWFGNARLFSGRWQHNAEYVRACVETLLRNLDHPWTEQTLGHVVALLRVSEALAERAGAERYAQTTSGTGEKIVVGASTVAQSSEHVRLQQRGARGDWGRAGSARPVRVSSRACRFSRRAVAGSFGAGTAPVGTVQGPHDGRASDRGLAPQSGVSRPNGRQPRGISGCFSRPATWRSSPKCSGWEERTGRSTTSRC